MGLSYLLDTNILSEPTKPQPDAHVMRNLELYAGQYATSATVWHELNYGVERMPDSKRKEYLQAYLAALENNGLPILPYDRLAAAWLAQERARLANQGMVATYADGEIAAVAYSNQLILVTRNVKDFKLYSQLSLEDWFEAL
ncbi:MAG: type II toxin-antitoxin system VapC family toxin [Thiothrix sp.]|nr:MAG: type II toxin-antitoxin system VapC family toxin [Thiothrix sp.]